MSYCRFENTSQDLEDCYDNWQDTPDDELTDYELRGKKRILQLCADILADFGEE